MSNARLRTTVNKVWEIVFDDNVPFDAHVSTFFCRLSFYQLGNLSKIRKCLTQESSEIAVHAFITSKIDY